MFRIFCCVTKGTKTPLLVRLSARPYFINNDKKYWDRVPTNLLRVLICTKPSWMKKAVKTELDRFFNFCYSQLKASQTLNIICPAFFPAMLRTASSLNRFNCVYTQSYWLPNIHNPLIYETAAPNTKLVVKIVT